ncbi:MAG: radical SAM family heme chaperone HemW [Candidatus Margulisiibacteriota bacterium]
MSEVKSLYIHLPFCKKKCNYCDFVSYAGKESLIDDYVEALIKEIRALTRLHSGHLPLPEGEGLKTIYFGGGTPTLLSPKHFDKIISTIISHSSLVISHSEISLEANPGTADKAKLKALRELGINRLSIGAQSFNDDHLKTLGRIHDSKQILKFYDDARSAGFENINLDLIFALPNQTLAEWQNDLKIAISMEPDHLSTYNLQIEEGTLFAKKYKSLDDEIELKMYEHTIETLTASGFKHYEISNFAKPGRECQHNIVYWKNENYLGLGAGAHSHVAGKRWANSESVEAYISLDPETKRLGSNKININSRNRDVQSQVPSQSETIFMGLRLLDGIPADNFNGFEKQLSELIENNLLMRENSHVKLTRKGLYLANEVFEQFV